MLMGRGVFRMLSRLLHQAVRVSDAHQDRHDGDEHDAADPFASHELPAEQEVENDAEFNDKVG